ncbi:MAG TPA: molecular chaperone DnaJ [Deltaproteobacteria bacterium]|nr:molecular chaperone DnaJ [Deltaproteobacteria bacterium]
MGDKDYYQVLGLERSASGASIKDAYRKLAFEYHPDRNSGDPTAVERMKEINEAYAVLSDPMKRQRYDSLRREFGSSAYDRFRQGYSDQDIFRGSDINQIFEEMARAFGFRSFDEVFRDSYGSTYRTYQFSRPGVFGKFIIMRPGQHQTSGRTQGEVGQDVGSIGTGLLGRLASSAVRYLIRSMLGASGGTQSADRKGSIDILPQQAEMGGKVRYTDPDTMRQVTISVPAGVTEGQVLRLKGMGAEDPSGHRGDLYLCVHVKRSLVHRLKSLLTGKG